MTRRNRVPTLRIATEDLIVDSFAGGGGASLGIEWALGRSPDLAINHDAEAIAMHAVNHPATKHVVGDVWDVDPKRAVGNKRVALAWFSPDCKHFSKAKGGKPVEKKVRGLAWVVIRWARAVKPRVIILENVEEFADWGPLREDNRPDPARRGLTFRRWLGQLKACGYEVETRELRACDFGAPTIRKRLFVIARCDGLPIVWPEPTHGTPAVPHRTAAECIEWSLSCPSIFEPARPLADNTLRRIARGVWRFVVGAKEPFIIPVTHAGDARVHGLSEPFRTITAAQRGELAFVSPTLIQTGWGERPGQVPRVPGLHKPLGTVTATRGPKHALVAAFLAKHYSERPTGGWNGGSAMSSPFGAVTVRDHHSVVATHLLKLRGTCRDGQQLALPFPTVCARGQHLAEVRTFLTRYAEAARCEPHGRSAWAGTETATPGRVTIDGEHFEVADIGMRMLVPRELFRAQGFPDSYVIDPVVDGEPLTKTAQVRMCGNSVSPVIAASLVAAQFGVERQVAA